VVRGGKKGLTCRKGPSGFCFVCKCGRLKQEFLLLFMVGDGREGFVAGIP
jgi:hypothetical protein